MVANFDGPFAKTITRLLFYSAFFPAFKSAGDCHYATKTMSYAD